jgi:putative transposase
MPAFRALRRPVSRSLQQDTRPARRGADVFPITTDGEVVENPRHYRTAQKQLARAHRRVSRRQQGSTRRRKAVQLLARTHQQVHGNAPTSSTRPRSHSCSSTTSSIWRMCRSATWSETASWPSASAMPTGQRFGPSSQATAAGAGRQVVAVPAQYTSQDCSGVLPDGGRCPQLVATSLSVRTRVCCLSVLWTGHGPRRERGPHHSSGRAGPLGANVAGWSERRLSSPWLSPWGACHMILIV